MCMKNLSLFSMENRAFYISDNLYNYVKELDTEPREKMLHLPLLKYTTKSKSHMNFSFIFFLSA